MGWKNLKNHFNLKYIVHVQNDYIHIGNKYINNIISINIHNANIKVNNDFWNDRIYINENNEILYHHNIDQSFKDIINTDKQILLDIINSEDNFHSSITLYTFDKSNGDIIELTSEHTEFPNVTHNGTLIYDHCFSIDKDLIIKKAKDKIQQRINGTSEFIDELQKDINTQTDKLNSLNIALEKLKKIY